MANEHSRGPMLVHTANIRTALLPHPLVVRVHRLGTRCVVRLALDLATRHICDHQRLQKIWAGLGSADQQQPDLVEQCPPNITGDQGLRYVQRRLRRVVVRD